MERLSKRILKIKKNIGSTIFLYGWTSVQSRLKQKPQRPQAFVANLATHSPQSYSP